MYFPTAVYGDILMKKTIKQMRALLSQQVNFEAELHPCTKKSVKAKVILGYAGATLQSDSHSPYDQSSEGPESSVGYSI